VHGIDSSVKSKIYIFFLWVQRATHALGVGVVCELTHVSSSMLFPRKLAPIAEYENVSPTDAADMVLDTDASVKSMLLPGNNNPAWPAPNTLLDIDATEDLEVDTEDDDDVLCGCILFVLSVPGLVMLLRFLILFLWH